VPTRIAADNGVPLPLPSRANEPWSVDFMSDQLADGRVFRTLSIVDDLTRECRAIQIAASLSARRAGTRRSVRRAVIRYVFLVDLPI